MQNNKIVLCFREGEPFLFNFNTKTFLKLCIDYESTIVQIKKMIEKQNKRNYYNDTYNLNTQFKLPITIQIKLLTIINY